MTDTELQEKRLMAAGIDAAIAIGIAVVFWTTERVLASSTGTVIGEWTPGVAGHLQRLVGFIGAAAGVGYLLLRDVLVGGQSLGKKLQGLRVVTKDGAPLGVLGSARRNVLFAIGPGLGLFSAGVSLVPCLGQALACLLWGLVIAGGVATAAAVVVEIVKIVQDEDGVRFGDQLAETRVITDGGA